MILDKNLWLSSSYVNNDVFVVDAIYAFFVSSKKFVFFSVELIQTNIWDFQHDGDMLYGEGR